MAYMCADSGNLMAIAQQVIQQKQQQQRQQQQQQQLGSSAVAVNAAAATPPWGGIADHHFPFVLPDPVFPDAFSAADHGFPPADFRLSDFVSSVSAGTEFESDEWMESLIGDSPPDKSDLLSDAWESGGRGGGADGGGGGGGSTTLHPLFSEPAAYISAAATFPPAATTDVNRVILAESRQIKPCDPPSPSSEPKEDVAPVTTAAAAAASSPLLKSLLDCARAADSRPILASKTLARIKEFASDAGDATQRVVFYFAEALSHRLSSASPPPVRTLSPGELTLCYKTLNDACPYSKFAHLTANQAILEATESASKIHIVDFGIVHGVQWAALLQALATRSSGKPDRVRISGVPSSALGGSRTASLSATGNRLRDFADLLDLDFEFVPVLDPIRELTEPAFKVEHGEAVAVNFMLQLHHLLDQTGEAAAERVVKLAKALAPRVVTLGEHEASVNRGAYSERFGSALSFYAAAFESIDAAMDCGSAERAAAERGLLGHRILGTVGPEGERRLRTEGRDAWRALMVRCGMEAVKISHYAVSQARILLWSYDYSSRYGLVESPPGFLSLAWDDRPLLTVSSWR